MKSYSTDRYEHVHFGDEQEKLCSIEKRGDSPKILLTSSALDQIDLDVNELIPLFDKLQRFIHPVDWGRFFRKFSDVDRESLDKRSQDILDHLTDAIDESIFTEVSSPLRNIVGGVMSSVAGFFANSSSSKDQQIEDLEQTVSFPLLPDLGGSGDSDDGPRI